MESFRLRSGYGFQFFLVSIRIFGLFNKKHLTGNPMEPWGKYWLLEMQETLNAKILGAIPGVVLIWLKQYQFGVFEIGIIITTSYAFWPKINFHTKCQNGVERLWFTECFLGVQVCRNSRNTSASKSVVCVSVLHKHHSLTKQKLHQKWSKMNQRLRSFWHVWSNFLVTRFSLVVFCCVFFEQKRVVCTRITEEKTDDECPQLCMWCEPVKGEFEKPS